jgi:Fic family protein
MKSFPPAPRLDAADWQNPALITRVLQLASTIGDSDYLHWEQLRHRPPPDGFSSLEWWKALKFKRQMSCTLHPLLHAYGSNRARTSRHATIEARLANLNRLLGTTIAHSGGAIDEDARDRYISSSLMEEAIHSSLLEGAVATREAAKDMLREGRAPTSLDERMIVNNHRAIIRLREIAASPLTVERVLELHSILTDGTLPDPRAAGRMQTPADERNVVWDKQLNRVVHQPPPAEELPDRLLRLVEFANADDIENETYTHPIVRSILLHFQLAFDHPFADGNGRLARALFYWSMLHRGYWMAEFISITRLLYRNRNPYMLAYLYVESDEQDATYFVKQQLDVIELAVGELHAYIERKRADQEEIRRRVGVRTDLNSRQLALLHHALRKRDAAYTHESHASSHNISIPTSRSDLQQLVRKKFLMQDRRGNKFVYRPATNIEARLKN